MKHIIVLGNDPELLELPLEKLQNKNCIVTGVNRIPYIYKVDYLFFLDNIVINEFENFNLSNTIGITSKYNLIEDQVDLYKKEYLDTLFKEHIYIDENLMTRDIFGSIPCLMVAMQEYIYPLSDINFYLLGSSLFFKKGNSHFWKNTSYESNIQYKKDDIWYVTRFNRIKRSLKFLKHKKNYKIVSCHKNNKHLKFLSNISFDNLIDIIS